MKKGDRIGAAVAAILGFVGGVFLQLFTEAAPILVAVLLATGVAALVYAFLGGIEQATFSVGALKRPLFLRSFRIVR